MKTYNERLPLIDAAIEALKGIFPPTAIGYSGRGYYAKGDFANILHGVNIGDICTRDEFEQRKAELAAKEQDMNDWYEKGELPPVGAVVEVAPLWDRALIVAHNNGDCVFFNKVSEKYDCFRSGDYFRPLRTETDKLIEQMERSFESTGCVFTNDHRALAEHLIEQGYRKIKPMSEQEFMKQCVDICGHGDARLYRAGCRFLDQGE